MVTLGGFRFKPVLTSIDVLIAGTRMTPRTPLMLQPRLLVWRPSGSIRHLCMKPPASP